MKYVEKGGTSSGGYWTGRPYSSGWSYDGTDMLSYTGGSQPHNNMPPYLAVYVWKRTA